MTRAELREDLLKVRGEIIGQFHVQPYIVFQDESIDDLLDVQPKTLEELSTIKGFPKDGKRVQTWGKFIVNVFKEKNEKKSFNDFLKEMDLFGSTGE